MNRSEEHRGGIAWYEKSLKVKGFENYLHVMQKKVWKGMDIQIKLDSLHFISMHAT